MNRPFPSFAFASCLAFLLGAGTAFPQEHPILQEAERQARHRNAEKAIELYQRFVHENIEHPQAPWAGVRIVELERLLALKQQETRLREELILAPALPHTRTHGPPASPSQTRFALAQCLTAQGRFQDARKVYESLVTEKPSSPEELLAPYEIAALLEREEHWNSAINAYQTALESHSRKLQCFLGHPGQVPYNDPNAGYFSNRARLGEDDQTAAAILRVIALARKLKKESIAEQARAKLAALKPAGSPFQQHLQAARALLDSALVVPPSHGLSSESGTRQDLTGTLFSAIAHCLDALEFPPFVPPTAKPVLPENKAQLAALQWSHTLAGLEQLFEVFDEALKAGKLRDAGTDSLVRVMPRVWFAASTFTKAGAFAKARETLFAFIQTSPGSLAENLAHYGIGLDHAREGLYPEAIEELELAGRSPVIALNARFKIGLAQFHQGLYREARQTFSQVLDHAEGTPLLTGPPKADSPLTADGSLFTAHCPLLTEASYRLAQCQEFLGNFAEAQKLYLKVPQSDHVNDLYRGLAETAMKRLADCAPQNSTRARAAVLVFPEPRTLNPEPSFPYQPCTYIGQNIGDRGRWYLNHGSEVAILCSMFAPQDVVCQRGHPPALHGNLNSLPLNYRFTTGKEGERGRRWLSKRDDPGGPDLALWNPITGGTTLGVFDDFGEQMGADAGDLILKLSIPRSEKPWRISLCFTNDHGFFESSRRYVIHVRERDENGQFLAGCAVEDFLTPVYKHFAVQGGMELWIRIFRGGSLNTLLSGIFLDPLSVRSAPLQRVRCVGSAPRQRVSAAVSDIQEPPEGAHYEQEPSKGMHYGREDRKGLYGQFEEELGRARSAERQREALAGFADAFLRQGNPDVVKTFLAALSANLSDSGRFGNAFLVDRFLLDFCLKHGLETASLLSSVVDRYSRPGYSGIGQELFGVCLDSVSTIEDAKQGKEKLAEMLQAQIADGRWALAEMVLARIRKAPERGEEAELEFPELAFRIYSGQGRYREAAEELERVIRQQESLLTDDLADPAVEADIGQGYFDLVCHEAAAGNLQAAEKALTNAELYLNDKNRLANAHYLVGLRTLQVSQNQQRAEFHFGRVVEEHPKTHWAKLAQSYLAQAAEASREMGP